MAELSLRRLSSPCLGRRARSMLRDVFGVYGSNVSRTRARSLRQQLERIRTKPFVRVACVTVRPTGSVAGQVSTQQRDLDNASDVFEQRCGMWVYCSGSQVVRTDLLGANGMFDQRDCNAGWLLYFIGIGDHEVSREEDQLFALGRDVGADVVGYYLPGGATSGLLAAPRTPMAGEVFGSDIRPANGPSPTNWVTSWALTIETRGRI